MATLIGTAFGILFFILIAAIPFLALLAMWEGL
jgi:hypothetical protein